LVRGAERRGGRHHAEYGRSTFRGVG
jgi:hypothetical protein